MRDEARLRMLFTKIFKSCLLLLSICLPMCLAVSQEKPNQPTTFKSRTELVEIPVLVKDKNGKHVSGLKQEDFEVLENGSAQKISFFEEVKTGTERMQVAESAPGTFTNEVQGELGAKRVTILVLDLLNTQSMDQKYARDQLMKFLAESLDANEPTAFFILTQGGLRMIHDFTSDPKLLIEAVKAMREFHDMPVENPVAQQQEIQELDHYIRDMPEFASFIRVIKESAREFNIFQQRTAILVTLQAMQQLARYVKGIPGRKSVVWATGGFPFSLSNIEESFEHSMRDSMADIVPQYQSTWRVLINANVALYTVDVRGLLPTASVRTELQMPTGDEMFGYSFSDWAQGDSMDTLRVFAEATGGKAFLNTNDISRSFREAADDSSEYYLLSFYLDRKAKPGWHKLSVKVKHEGVHVRARTGFIVISPKEEKAIQEVDINSALRSPINYSEIPIVFGWTDRNPAKDPTRRRIGYQVEVPANRITVDDSDRNHMVVQFTVLVRNADGKELEAPQSRKLDMHLTPASLAQVRDSGVTYRSSFELPPGGYSVRFVVRDALSGRMGSVSAAIAVAK
jgi:VWFA-related protein